jgi:hypothetical protein
MGRNTMRLFLKQIIYTDTHDGTFSCSIFNQHHSTYSYLMPTTNHTLVGFMKGELIRAIRPLGLLRFLWKHWHPPSSCSSMGRDAEGPLCESCLSDAQEEVTGTFTSSLCKSKCVGIRAHIAKVESWQCACPLCRSTSISFYCWTFRLYINHIISISNAEYRVCNSLRLYMYIHEWGSICSRWGRIHTKDD